ncbi:MAG: hypothetical protein ACXVHL_30845, partial [Solirubrobacteraceae bacterium]
MTRPRRRDDQAAQPTERSLVGAGGDAAQSRSGEGEQVDEQQLPPGTAVPERRRAGDREGHGDDEGDPHEPLPQRHQQVG